ncbi:hypothetical protein U1Q18_021309 [Sarracenia purpurea var. burkii]
MVRGKTQMKKIEDVTSRQVTFSKRKRGLLKKAFELSVLCDVEVALIIFSTRGKFYEFSSLSMNKTIERYQRHANKLGTDDIPVHEDFQTLKEKEVFMSNKIELLEVSKRKLLGDCLESCSIDELQQIEEQLGQSLSNIKARKDLLLKEKTEQLQKMEKALEEENATLRKKSQMLQSSHPSHPLITPPLVRTEISEVNTDLFIGLPFRVLQRM